MRDECDVVVAGGGPAGLQFAREIASRSGFTVAVLERNKRIRDNDKSTGGTFEEVVDGYDVPERVVMAETDTVTFEGPTSRSLLDIDGYVLDFPRFLEFLSAEAEAAGADVFTGVRVEGVRTRNEQVRGVRYTSDGTSNALRATLTVDATGPDAVLTSTLGFFDPTEAQRGIGLEFEAHGRYETEGTMLFRFDHEDAPGGYAWTFPAGCDRFKAGVCWVDDFCSRHRTERSIHTYVERWVDRDPRWNVTSVAQKHAGEVRSNNSMNRRVTDGVMAIGDSVSSINPLFGEGIRPAMESATMAADVAIPALRDGDVSEMRLVPYENRWNERRGRAWKLQRIVGELLYDFDADQQDAFVDRLARLSPSATERLRSYQLTPVDLLRLYPFKPKDISKVPELMRHL